MKWQTLGWIVLFVALVSAGGCKRKSRYFLIGEGDVVPSESIPKVIARSP